MRALAIYKALLKKPARRRVSNPPAPRARLQLEALETRLVPYNISGNAWPHPELITISLMPDGTNLGGVTSNLFATFNAKWAPSVWQYQILRAAQDWAQQTNINFALVSDSGADSGSGAYEQGDPTMGDIRIGGYAYSTSILATGSQPPPANNYSVAGDITINTAEPWVINTSGGYDIFTVVSHEIGHSLGLLHSSAASADLFAYYTSIKTALKNDDINGIRAIYSNYNPRSYDAFGGTNYSFSTAANLSAQIDPTALTALVTNLDNTNSNGSVEYFTFTAPAATTGTLTVNVQSSGLSLLAPVVTVYAANQTTVLGSASGAGQYGTTLSVTVNGVTAGQQFYVKVAGADASAFGAGKYAMTLNFGSSPSPTVPLPNTQTLNGVPISGSGGLAMMVYNQNQNETTLKTDNLTVQGFNSLMHGGGCGCPACRAAASVRQAPQVYMSGYEAFSSKPSLGSAVSNPSLGGFPGEPGSDTLRGMVGTAIPEMASAVRNQGIERTLPDSAHRTAPVEQRAEEDGTGKAIRSGSEKQPVQAPSSIDAGVSLQAPLPVTDTVSQVGSDTGFWQQASEACFAEEGRTVLDVDTAWIALRSDEGSSVEGRDLAAACALALAVYGFARPEELERHKRLPFPNPVPV